MPAPVITERVREAAGVVGVGVMAAAADGINVVLEPPREDKPWGVAIAHLRENCAYIDQTLPTLRVITP